VNYLKCKITEFVGRFLVSRTTRLELIPREQDYKIQLKE